MTRRSSELLFTSIAQVSRLLQRKEISSLELVDAVLLRIEERNPKAHAFITVLGDQARRAAKSADRAMQRSKPRSPLYGIPISLKDNFWTKGIRTTAGSKILAKFVPEEDSDVARKLAATSAIVVGKTNMHEFAYGITGENPHYGSSRNPWDGHRISGGSSGGSAVAVASGMGFASLGTDTGGSVRIPAALCGIVGLKPTYGLVSAAGVVPLSVSFDHVGTLARSVPDACIVFEAIAAPYPRGHARPNWRKLSNRWSHKPRIGWPRNFFFERIEPEVRDAVETAARQFESLGADIREVRLPHVADLIDRATNLVIAEASHYHESQGYYPRFASKYGKDVRGLLAWGHELRAVDYLNSFAAGETILKDFEAAFEHVDAIIAPTSPIVAPRLGEGEIRVAGERETKVRAELLRMTRPSNITGMPAISIPCGFTKQGLPIGTQLIGPRWSEARLLHIAAAYEESTDWHARHPD